MVLLATLFVMSKSWRMRLAEICLVDLDSKENMKKLIISLFELQILC